MADIVHIYRASVPANTESYVDWVECEGFPAPKHYIYDRNRSIDFAAIEGTVVASNAATTVTIVGECYPYPSCICSYNALPSTTTTTLAAVNFAITTDCTGTGLDGTGRITVNTFSGGNGVYYSVAIGPTSGDAFLAPQTLLSGATSYQFTSLSNGTYFIILRDSIGNFKINSIAVSCNATSTTTTSTSTTSTSTSTTTTTTAAPICTYNGGSVSIVYGTSTTSTSTTTSTTSTTTAGPTSTTTTSTSTSTSTTTVAPTSTTSTTTTSPYNYYSARRYDCTDCTQLSGTFKIRFASTFFANVNRWYRPTTPDGYTYKPIALTSAGASIDCDEPSYPTCISACNLSTTTTSTTSTSTTSTSTSTSTTTAAPLLIYIQLDEYDGGNPPYLDMDMVVAGSSYYFDGGSYTQYVPANVSSNITLKTKDGIASHLWGSFTTASANLKVFEDGILIVDQTNFYRKNEGAVDFTSGVTFNSGKSYIVSGSNWTFVGVQPTTTTTTSTTSTTTVAPTSTTSTTTASPLNTSTTTTCAALPPHSYTLYYDYDDSIVFGANTAEDACNLTNNITVYSYDNPLVAGSELFVDSGCGPSTLYGIRYDNSEDTYYRIGADVIRLTDYDGLIYIIYDFVQTCNSTSTTTTTTTTAAPTYIAYNADKYPCGNPNCGSLDSSVEIAFTSGFTPIINKWYTPPSPDGFAYQLTSTTPSAGPGLVMYEQSFNTCELACQI